MPDSPAQYDVAIVGGGMVGASLAAALLPTGLRLLLIESIPPGGDAQPSFDARTTALGNASRRILEGLGAWGELAPHAAPIRSIHVSDAGRFGFARLEASEQGLEAFGYVIANAQLGAALWGRLRAAPQLTVRAPAAIADLAFDADCARFEIQAAGHSVPATARVVVGADGARSQVRLSAGIGAQVVDYAQVALVANLTSDAAHAGAAFERFTPDGPLAVLPLADGRRTVVWAVPVARAPQLLGLGDTDFIAELQRTFGWRAGRFSHAGRRASYPLTLTRAAAPTAARSVLIGNAAQALHPVAGQGFNLGLRDAAMLAECLADAVTDVGAPAVLERFATWRAGDRRGVTGFTDGLVRLFGDSRPGVAWLRDLGLLAFDLLPPAKAALARVSAGFAGPAPRLARGLPVRHA